ncbi:uncharacterized protein LOC128156393 isoform X2 [Crassostrea angulata]|uniref:uncharacterized protein LOC128156393 isoform X2 n=1 Tax=Magallana angulata TaxID=2784310 RepID=UPI0022B0FA02|nr:uncharacterized protein LOC128156393 isoform X2 [Crassostrea angulata]
MPRGKPARKRPAASASAERQPAQSSKRRHTGRSTANPVPAVEDNINAVSNSAPATNDATDAVCTPSLDSASVNGPGSSIQGSTAEVVKVWIVGSSIIWQAFSHARLNGGSNLDFSPMEANIWWQGKGGMRWRHLLPKIRQMLRYEDPPHFLVLHCGGNDIGQIKSSELREKMEQSLDALSPLLPRTKIIWSQILPRLKWRNARDNNALNKTRVRVNSFVATKLLAHQGGYIRYQKITPSDKSLFKGDGVHLTEKGNEIFLKTLKKAFKRFISSGVGVY